MEDMLFDVREKEEELISRWVEENAHEIIACERCVEGVLEERIYNELMMGEEVKVIVGGIRRRAVYEKVRDFELTSWMRLYKHEDTSVVGSYRYKLFRRRFRVPAPLFREVLIPLVKEKNIFGMINHSRIPVEIKTMIALRILGRGSTADDMFEMSGVGESTCNAIFKQFIRGMSAPEVRDSLVKPPTGERFTEVLDTYSRLGFPGAVGSIDCTHVQWNRCPVELANFARGKEQYPLVAFEVVVDHSGLIHSCSDSFLGTFHDAILVLNDRYPQEIAAGLYKDVEFSLYESDGQLRTFRGGYLISDAGYTKKWMFQMPNLRTSDPQSVYWSEIMESVRKDVERVFGILKQRFIFVAHRVQYHSRDVLENAVHTCCALHNLLHAYDQYSNIDWEHLDPDAEDDNGEEIAAQRPLPRIDSGLGLIPHTSGAGITEFQNFNHRLLEYALQNHFTYCFARGHVVWPVGFSATQRVHFPRKSLLNSTWSSLYTAQSWCRARDPETNQFTKTIGSGLFTSVAIARDQRLCTFSGVICTAEQYAEAEAAGRGGYAIHINADTLIDCYKTKHLCLASMANCGSNVRSMRSGVPTAVQNNCRLVVRSNPPSASLVSTCRIRKHEEILWDYGAEYVYPN